MKYLSIVLLCSATLSYGMDKKSPGQQLDYEIAEMEKTAQRIKASLAPTIDPAEFADVQVVLISYKERIKTSAIADLNSHNFNKREKLAYIQDKLDDAEFKCKQLSSDGLIGKFFDTTNNLVNILAFKAAARAETWAELKKETQVLPRRRANIGELNDIVKRSTVITERPAIRYKSTTIDSSAISFGVDEGPNRVVSRADASTSIKPRYKRCVSSSSSEDESVPVHLEALYNEVPATLSVDIPVHTSSIFNEKPVSIDMTEFDEHYNKERGKLAAMYALERVRLEESKDNLLKQFPDLLIEDSKAAYRPGRHALTSLDRCISNLTDTYAYKLVALNGYLSGPKKDTTLEDNEMYIKTFAGKMDGSNYTFTYEDKLKNRPWRLAKTNEEKQAEYEAYLRGEYRNEGDPESEEDETTLEIERSFLRRYYNN